MTQVKFNLIVQKGPTPGEVFELTGHELTVGRDVDNEVTINDVEVSRHHARLVRSGDTFTIQDLGSTNGTFINEQRISGMMPLQSGDSVRMGDNVFLLFEVERILDQTAPSSSHLEAPSPNPQPAAPQAQAPMQRPTPTPQRPAPQRATPQPMQRPQQYAGMTPESPEEITEGINWRWVGIGCGAILILFACAIITFLIYVDMNSLWCNWLGWMLPNRCPIL